MDLRVMKDLDICGGADNACLCKSEPATLQWRPGYRKESGLIAGIAGEGACSEAGGLLIKHRASPYTEAFCSHPVWLSCSVHSRLARKRAILCWDVVCVEGAQ